MRRIAYHLALRIRGEEIREIHGKIDTALSPNDSDVFQVIVRTLQVALAEDHKERSSEFAGQGDSDERSDWLCEVPCEIRFEVQTT